MVTHLDCFCSPLFFVLQALVDVSIVDGDLDLVNEAVLYLSSIFRAIRKAEDAVDAQMTTVKYFQLLLISYIFLYTTLLELNVMQKLHMLAEIGLFTLNSLNHGRISLSQAPRQVLLPSSLYRVGITKNDVSFQERLSLLDTESLIRSHFHVSFNTI